MSNTKTSPTPLKSGFYDPVIHITTHNAQGQATIHSADHNPWGEYLDGRAYFNEIFSTAFPANLNTEADIKTHEKLADAQSIGIYKSGGTNVRMIDIGPGATKVTHRTQSLDVGLVMEGVLQMELDDGSITTMKKGDIFVQRGTMHGWIPPKEWVRILCFLQESQPITLGEGGKELNPQLDDGILGRMGLNW